MNTVPQKTPKFEPGDCVHTVGRTYREGLIARRLFHHKADTYLYYLKIGNRLHKTRYREEELDWVMKDGKKEQH